MSMSHLAEVVLMTGLMTLDDVMPKVSLSVSDLSGCLEKTVKRLTQPERPWLGDLFMSHE
jgi:hypothetical protein